MNEKICKNCRYFGEEVTKREYDEEFNSFLVKTGFHACERIKHYENAHCEQGYNQAQAHVVDGSGYFAALRVPSDFGCVMFEKKDPD